MPPGIPLPTFLGLQIPLLLHKSCLCSTLACPPSIFDFWPTTYSACRHKDSGTAASVTQLRLHRTPFPKNYLIAHSLFWVARVYWRHICFIPRLMGAERRALLSLHLHFVAQYKFFVNIIILVSFSSGSVHGNSSWSCRMKHHPGQCCGLSYGSCTKVAARWTTQLDKTSRSFQWTIAGRI